MNQRTFISLLIVILLNVSLSINAADSSKQVRVKITSPGCYTSGKDGNDAEAAIFINGTNYSYGVDGITIVVIETGNFSVSNIVNINNEAASVNGSLMEFFKQQDMELGAVVVFATQDTCFEDFDYWFNLLKTVENFHTERFSYGEDEMTAVVIGCYGECPYVVKGDLPVSKFGDEEEIVDLEVTFGVNGYKPLPQRKEDGSSSTVIIIIVVILLVIVCFILIVVLYCLYKRKKRSTPLPLPTICQCCCQEKLDVKGDEERIGLAADSSCDGPHTTNDYTPLGSCLMKEEYNLYTTLEKKEIPKTPYSATADENHKHSENLYYSKRQDESMSMNRQISNDLYEPLAEDSQNQLLPKPAPRDIVIDKGGGESVIYKTPSNASSYNQGDVSVIYKTPSNASSYNQGDVVDGNNHYQSPTKEQHYQAPTNHREQTKNEIPTYAAGHGRQMFKRGENDAPHSGNTVNKSSTKEAPNQSENHIYKEPRRSDAQNDRGGNLNTPTPPPATFQSSPGTSHKLFKEHQELPDSDDEDFASYIQLDESDVIYKTPSNVMKHEPPKTVPKNIYQVPLQSGAVESNGFNDTGEDESNLYDPVDAQEDDDETNYENFKFHKT